MSGLPSPFEGHFCPECGEQCHCLSAVIVAGPEEEDYVTECEHDCAAAREQALALEGTYKPGHSGGFPF